MKTSLISLYFKLINFLLYTVAAITEHIELKTPLKTFLFNKVWPHFFVVFWIPLVYFVIAKIVYTISKENWEDLLDIMHMFLLGINTLYLVVAVEKTRQSYKSCMDEITKNFISFKKITVRDFTMRLLLWFIIANSFCFCIISTIYYGELLVPVYIPFLDNDEDLPTLVFLLVFAYELVAGAYMVIAYGLLVPFVIVATGITVNELDFIILKLNQFNYQDWIMKSKSINLPTIKYNKELLLSVCENNKMRKIFVKERTTRTNKKEAEGENTYMLENTLRSSCFSELDAKQFVKRLVQHHHNIQR